MICPYCGETIYPSRPLEYIYCVHCQHRLDYEDIKDQEESE